MRNRDRPEGGGALSLGDALHGKSNSLGVVRLALASLVIFDHAFKLGGFGQDLVFRLTNGQTTLGTLAVGGFFAISGYLITTSGMSCDAVQFMWRRVLRIFPAYWLVLLVTAFVIGPAIWMADGKDLAQYFAGSDPYRYVYANWTLDIGSDGIYDVFASTPYGQVIQRSLLNGSIWTLLYEWNCYLLIGVLVAAGMKRYGRFVIPFAAVFFLLLSSNGSVAVWLAFTFFAGATVAAYSRWVPFDDRLGILAVVVFLLSLRWGGFFTVGTLAGAYFVLYIGARLPRAFQWIGAKNDYSYGVYIYGFVVQQIFAYVGWYRWGYVPYVAISLAAALALGWLSWHLVEKRAMTLKNWGPGRGIRYWRDQYLSKRPQRWSAENAGKRTGSPARNT